MTQIGYNVPNVGVPDATINPQTAGGPSLLGSLSRGATQIGGALQEVQDKREELDYQRQYAAGMSELMIAEAKARAAAQEADPSESETVYRQHMEAWNKEASNTTNKRAREKLMVEGQTRFGLGEVRVQQDSFKRLRSATVDSYRGAVKTAISQGQYATADQLMTQAKPYMGEEEWADFQIDIRQARDTQKAAQIDAQKEAIGAETDYLAAQMRDIDPDTMMTADERTRAMASVAEAIELSDLPGVEKKKAKTHAINKLNAANDSVAQDIEQVATDTDLLPKLEELRQRVIDMLPVGPQRERALAHIDDRIRSVKKSKPDIDIGVQLYDRTMSVGEDVKAAPGSDQALNSVFQHGLDIGDSPAQTIGNMLDTGFPRIAPRAVDYINAQFAEGGDRVAGVAALAAIQNRRPNEAERIAREIGDDAETLLWAGTKGMEIGLFNEQQFAEFANSTRVKTQVSRARQIMNPALRDENDNAAYNFDAHEYLSGNKDKTYGQMFKIGATTAISPVAGAWMMLKNRDKNKPVSASQQIEFEQAAQAIYAWNMISTNANALDDKSVSEAMEDAKVRALDAVSYYQQELPTGPMGSDLRTVNIKPYGLNGKKLKPGERGLDGPATEAFINAIQDATTTTIAGQAPKLPWGSNTEVSGRDIRAKLDAPVQFGDKVLIPLVRSDADEMSTGPVGFLEWDGKSLGHRIILPSSAKPSVPKRNVLSGVQFSSPLLSKVAVSKGTVSEPNEVYDDQVFNNIKGMVGDESFVNQSLSAYRWSPKFGNVSVHEYSQAWFDQFVESAEKRTASELGYASVSQMYANLQDATIIGERAKRLCELAGWPSLLPESRKVENGRTDNANTE